MAFLNVPQSKKDTMPRITVELDTQTFDTLRAVAELHGRTTVAEAALALVDWVDTVGVADLEAHAERAETYAQC